MSPQTSELETVCVVGPHLTKLDRAERLPVGTVYVVRDQHIDRADAGKRGWRARRSPRRSIPGPVGERKTRFVLHFDRSAGRSSIGGRPQRLVGGIPPPADGV